MRLTVGSKVIYPNQGPCLIGSVVQKVIAGSPVSFYQLALLDGSGGELFVPVDKAQTTGLRSLLNSSEVPKLFHHLQQPIEAAKGWKQRAQDNSKRLASGSAFDLADVVKSLTELSEKKELSFPESRMLDKARRLLVCELAEVLKDTKSAVEGLIDQALKAGKIVGHLL